MNRSLENILIRARWVVPVTLMLIAISCARRATAEEKTNLPSDPACEAHLLRAQRFEKAGGDSANQWPANFYQFTATRAMG